MIDDPDVIVPFILTMCVVLLFIVVGLLPIL